MKEAAVRELRNLIAVSPSFDMCDSDFYLSCGTAGCIGGHAALLWEEVRFRNTFDEHELGRKLGINQEEAHELCFVSKYRKENEHKWPIKGTRLWYDIHREQALAVLDELADTGLVNWAKVMDPMLEEKYGNAIQEAGVS